MPDANDLRRIHHRYSLALDTEEKAKAILVGDKLKFATEQMLGISNQIRLDKLTYAFKYYEDVRNDIGKLDDDIIGLLNEYIKDVSEMADKIAMENSSLRARAPAKIVPRPRFQEEEIDLGEDGKPHFITQPSVLTEPNNMVPKPEPMPTSATNGPAEQAQEEELESPATQPPAPPREEPKPFQRAKPDRPSILDFKKEDRAELVRRAYNALPDGHRTSVQIVKYFQGRWSLKVTRNFVVDYCRALNLKLQGQQIHPEWQDKLYKKSKGRQPINPLTESTTAPQPGATEKGAENDDRS